MAEPKTNKIGMLFVTRATPNSAFYQPKGLPCFQGGGKKTINHATFVIDRTTYDI